MFDYLSARLCERGPRGKLLVRGLWKVKVVADFQLSKQLYLYKCMKVNDYFFVGDKVDPC